MVVETEPEVGGVRNELGDLDYDGADWTRFEECGHPGLLG